MDISNNCFFKKFNKPSVLLASAFAITAVATVLRVLSLAFAYDKYIAYYTVGAVLPIISNVLYALGVIFFALVAFLFLNPQQAISTPNKTSRYVSLVPAAAMLFYTLTFIYEAFTKDGQINLLTILLLICSALSCVFFFSVLFCEQPSNLSVISGIGFIFWLGICWINSYRDFAVPMNSPDKLFFHFGCIGAALFIIGEIRAFYGISKPRFYLFSLLGAIISMAISAIPSIIGYFNDTFEVYSLLKEDIVLLALLVYASARVIEFASANKVSKQQETDKEASLG